VAFSNICRFICEATRCVGFPFPAELKGVNDGPNCQAKRSAVPVGSIFDSLDKDSRFATLVAGLKIAELVDTLNGKGPFTILAPTDDAFDKIPREALNTLLADKEALSKVLLKHVVAGTKLSKDLSFGELKSVAGEKLSVRTKGGKVYIDNSVVIDADIISTNGVIHVIDGVLLGRSAVPVGSIFDSLDKDSRFATLVAGLKIAKLVDTLNGKGPFTILAPTDDAFDKIPREALNNLLADKEALSKVLLKHVVAGTKLSKDLSFGELESVAGEKLSVRTKGGKVVIDDSVVIDADIISTNGVIHVIDRVLLGRSAVPVGSIFDSLDKDSRFATLVAGLKIAELVGTLNGKGPFTVFAPTDDAFDKLPREALNNLLDNKEALTKVLLKHVVVGTKLSRDLSFGELESVAGAKLSVRTKGGKVVINDSVVIDADIISTNGVIHVIDGVLLP
jgi:transforming growth factor-beta-induced protein